MTHPHRSLPADSNPISSPRPSRRPEAGAERRARTPTSAGLTATQIGTSGAVPTAEREDAVLCAAGRPAPAACRTGGSTSLITRPGSATRATSEGARGNGRPTRSSLRLAAVDHSCPGRAGRALRKPIITWDFARRDPAGPSQGSPNSPGRYWARRGYSGASGGGGVRAKHLLRREIRGAPGRIRTCAPGSGGRCSIP